MNKILLTISILIYTVYSQSCADTHSVSTMISYSVHGKSVNDLIGATTYNDIIKGAVADFTQSSSNQRVGVTAFGGLNDNTAFKWELLSLTAGDGATVASAIDGHSPDYGENFANVAAGAINTAITELSGESGRQKYHVIFSVTIPLAIGKGITTKPSDLDNICGQSITAKQNGIQQYVVLIGTEGESAFPSFWSCAVENPDTDIIVFDPTSTDYSPITDRLCKPNGYDIKITEVKPTSGSGQYNAYIEVLNRGAQASIMAGFSASYSSAVSTGTGEYFLARRTSGGGTTATASNEASLPSVSPTAGTWTANARIGSCSNQDLGCYDEVDYVAGTANYAVQPIDTRSFELRAVGYNNDYPANWRNSCYKTGFGGSLTGTPGADPEDECTPITASTTLSATTITGGSCGQVGTTSSSGTCTINNNAEQSPECSTDGDYCNCPSDGSYVGDIDTCAPLVLPVSTNGCTANIIKWWDNDDYIIYQWPRVEYDADVTYTMFDAGGASSGSIGVSGYGNQGQNSITDFTIDLSVSYTSPIENAGYANSVSGIDCGTPITVDPTPSPSKAPTGKPSEEPSVAPTLRPTFDAPGVYLTAVKTRGDCNQEDRSCCSPFGPQYGDTNTGQADTGETGTLPSGLDECDLYANNQIFEIQSADGDFVQKEFEFNLYPSGYTEQSSVVVKIYSYGLMNNSEWENLTFAGSYTDDGLIPGIVTAANRLLWGPDSRRRRLQNGTNTNSYEYGNKLNIGVSPPGDSGENPWSGDIIIPQGEGSASLTLNITLADLKCNEGDFDCTTLDDCTSQSLGFVLVAQSCAQDTVSALGDCKPLYPSTMFFSIKRATALCNINFGVGNNEDELPDWFWWVLIALIVFLLILAWLVYRFWWKQKKTASELGDAEDELDQQIADNEAGFGKELDVGDVAFNPMATGVPGMNRPADAFGNELHQRQIAQQNDMVDVQAEIFQVRQDYGQVNTGNRHHNQGGGGGNYHQQGGY